MFTIDLYQQELGSLEGQRKQPQFFQYDSEYRKLVNSVH